MVPVSSYLHTQHIGTEKWQIWTLSKTWKGTVLSTIVKCLVSVIIITHFSVIPHSTLALFQPPILYIMFQCGLSHDFRNREGPCANHQTSAGLGAGSESAVIGV